MAAYSLELRERIVEAVARRRGSKRQIAAVFGVHESFSYKLLRQKRFKDRIRGEFFAPWGVAET